MNTEELKYPETKALNCGLQLRPYITYEETKEIVEVLSEINDYNEREYTLNCILFKLCCGGEDGIDYDLLVVNNIFSEIRMELADYIDVIYDGVEYNDSVDRNVKIFLESLSKLADKAEKKMPTQKTFNKMIKYAQEKLDTIKPSDIDKIAVELKEGANNAKDDKE